MRIRLSEDANFRAVSKAVLKWNLTRLAHVSLDAFSHRHHLDVWCASNIRVWIRSSLEPSMILTGLSLPAARQHRSPHSQFVLDYAPVRSRLIANVGDLPVSPRH